MDRQEVTLEGGEIEAALRASIEDAAAEITQDVISAYESTGWIPTTCQWNVEIGTGCAVGVLAESDQHLTGNPYIAVGDRYGLAGFRFALGFDNGYAGTGEPSKYICNYKGHEVPDPDWADRMVGYIVGQNIRAWKSLRDIEAKQPEQKIMEVV